MKNNETEFTHSYSIMDLLENSGKYAIFSLKIFYILISIIILIFSITMLYIDIKIQNYNGLIPELIYFFFPVYIYILFNTNFLKIKFYKNHFAFLNNKFNYKNLENFKIEENLLIFTIKHETYKNLSIPLKKNQKKILEIFKSKKIIQL